MAARMSLSQTSLPRPSSPSRIAASSNIGNNGSAICTSSASNKTHYPRLTDIVPKPTAIYRHTMTTTTSASAGNEKRKRIGASNSEAPATDAAFVVTPTDSYNDDALPNEEDINNMDVAVLRQVVLSLVRVRKPTLSSMSAESPSASSYASSNATLSATASERSAELGDSAVPASNSALQARKRYRNDSDASDA
ncbi:hypothetical protein GGH92_009753, partial [Coemansia sp. RSA 2673]